MGSHYNLAWPTQYIIVHEVFILPNYPLGFSDGTIASTGRDITHGGACALNPPLKLTVNVLGQLLLYSYISCH